MSVAIRSSTAHGSIVQRRKHFKALAPHAWYIDVVWCLYEHSLLAKSRLGPNVMNTSNHINVGSNRMEQREEAGLSEQARTVCPILSKLHLSRIEL